MRRDALGYRYKLRKEPKYVWASSHRILTRIIAILLICAAFPLAFYLHGILQQTTSRVSTFHDTKTKLHIAEVAHTSQAQMKIGQQILEGKP